MKKNLSLSIIFALVLSLIAPTFSFADNLFTITNFTATSYTSGEEYTITLDSYSDLTDYEVSVTLGSKTLEIGNKAENSVKGILPEGLPSGGGLLTLTYGSQSITYNVKVPVITRTILPDTLEKDAQITVIGENFDDGCSVSIEGGSGISVDTCVHNKIVLDIGSDFKGGDLVVTSHGFKSNSYPISFGSPELFFAVAEGGLKPAATLEIYGENFNKISTLNYVYIGDTQLEVKSMNTSRTKLTVELPDENISGDLKVVSDGFETDSLSIKAMVAPVLLGYNLVRKDGKEYAQLIGRNFSIEKNINIQSL